MNERRLISCTEAAKCKNPICVHKSLHALSKSCEVYCLDTDKYLCRNYLSVEEKLLKRNFVISRSELYKLLTGKTNTVMLFNPDSRDAELWTSEDNPPISIVLIVPETSKIELS